MEERIRIDHLTAAADRRAELAADVRRGLNGPRKQLPPKWLYDAQGSALFEEITRLPEYYQTRAETEILEAVATALVADFEPCELVELGSGASRKTQLLLEAMHAAGSGERYVPFDVSEAALWAAAVQLTDRYPWLQVTGVVGDFETDLAEVPRSGQGLVAFLGSTIGNLQPEAQAGFLRRIVAGLCPGDALLVGFDLVKEPAVLEAAYDDAAGVTAAFNRNLLHMLNRELDADLPVEAFEHVARYDVEAQRVEMVLRPVREVVATFPTLDLQVHLDAGEEILTEISCKFTRDGVERLLADAGLALRRWDTDPQGRFALATAVADGSHPPG